MSALLTLIASPSAWGLAVVVGLGVAYVTKLVASMTSELADVKGSLSAIADKLDRDKDRLDTIEETLYHTLTGVVELGANGQVKKYRDKIAGSGRW